MLTRLRIVTAIASLSLLAGTPFADPITDLLSQTGLNALLTGSATGSGVEIDVLNPTGTGDNDILGLDLFTPENGLGLTLTGTEILGFGNPTGGTVIPLDFLGLDQLTNVLGLAPDSALVDALRNTIGPDGALIIPIVDSLQALSGLGDSVEFNFSDAIGLPGLSDQPIALAIAGADSTGNSTTDGIAGVALLTPGSSGNGGLIGLAVISGSNAGNGDLIGVSIIGGDNTGNGSLAGVAILSGDNSGNADFAGASVISGDSSGNGGSAGVAVLSGDNSGNSDGIAGGVISGDNSGNGGGVSVGVGGDNNGDGSDGTDSGGDCEGIACGEQSDDTQSKNLLVGNTECSEGDGDGDGVCDEVDDCKNTPANTAVFSSGCHLDDNTPLVLRGVHFVFGTTDVTDASISVLEEAQNIIKKYPNALISIDGHTDSKGSESYNEDLSYRRAQAIYQYFIKHDIQAERLTFRGFGEGVPIAANTTDSGADYPEGRALNRRVELSVLDRASFDEIKKANAARVLAKEEAARKAKADASRRAQQAREKAARAAEAKEKTEAAESDYEDVLNFLEETGAADTSDAEPEPASDSAISDDDSDYTLEVFEREDT